MRITKECLICSKEFAIHQCQVCGRVVCDTHFIAVKGICSECPSKQES